MEPTIAQGADKLKRHVHRSPAYPVISLKDALEKARLVHKEDKRFPVSRAVVLKHMGFADEKSGLGNRQLAATKQYGLIEETDSGFRISDLGYKLLFLSETSPERPRLLKTAARTPKIFKELWDRYGSEGSESNISDFLIHQREFNPSSVKDVIGIYRSTIHFANLADSDKIGEDVEDYDAVKAPGSQRDLQVGDFVQWTFGGVWQFEEPRRIRRLSEDGEWAFVEGSDTGLPIEDLTLETRQEAAPKPPLEPAKPQVNEKKRREPPIDIEQKRLLNQELVVSIPRKFRVDINVLGDELKREDLVKIKSQFNRWIEGIEEAFD